MLRTLWAMGKTYLTVKAVEMVANAFRGTRSKTAPAKAQAKRASNQRKRATA